MANTCANYIRMICKNEKAAQAIAQDMNKVLDANNRDKNEWDLVVLEEFYKLKPADYMYTPYMRSWIEAIYDKGREVIIESDSAWSPAVGIFREIGYKLNCVENVYYTSEELGCDVCVSNDPEMIGKYVIDLDCNIEYGVELQTAKEWVVEFCKENDICDLTDQLECFALNELVDEANKHDANIYYWKYEFEDIDMEG